MHVGIDRNQVRRLDDFVDLENDFHEFSVKISRVDFYFGCLHAEYLINFIKEVIGLNIDQKNVSGLKTFSRIEIHGNGFPGNRLR